MQRKITRYKRIMSLLLALTLVFSMTVSVMAATRPDRPTGLRITSISREKTKKGDIIYFNTRWDKMKDAKKYEVVISASNGKKRISKTLSKTAYKGSIYLKNRKRGNLRVEVCAVNGSAKSAGVSLRRSYGKKYKRY